MVGPSIIFMSLLLIYGYIFIILCWNISLLTEVCWCFCYEISDLIIISGQKGKTAWPWWVAAIPKSFFSNGSFGFYGFSCQQHFYSYLWWKHGKTCWGPPEVCKPNGKTKVTLRGFPGSYRGLIIFLAGILGLKKPSYLIGRDL